MVTVGELVADNSIYEEGSLLNKDYYKGALEGRDAQVISNNDLKFAYGYETLVVVAKRVAMVALVLIPAISLLSTGVLLGFAFAGVTAALMNELLSDELSIIKEVVMKSRVFAALSSKFQIKEILSDLTAFVPPIVYRVLFPIVGGAGSTFLAAAGVTVFFKAATEDLLRLGYDAMRKLADYNIQQELEQDPSHEPA